MDERDDTYTALERFLEILCSQVSALYMVFVVCVVLLVLSVISFLYLEPGSASYVLVQIDLALLVVFMAVIAWTLSRCRRYRA